MVRTVHCHVTTNAMVVTTITVPVIKGVNQVGRETTVNNVIYYNYTIMSILPDVKYSFHLNEYFRL